MTRLHRVAVTGLLCAPLLLAAVAPAAADDARLGISADGVHWTDGTAGVDWPLFDTAIRWVPGDVRTSRFFVRNESTDPGDLDVQIVRGDLGPLVADDYLTISARSGRGPWTVARPGRSLSILDTDDLASGRVVAVDVRARFLDGAPNASMVIASDIDFRVRLADAVPGDEPGDQPGRSVGPDGVLPATGSDLTPGVVWLALLLLGSGTYLVARRHRDDETPEEIAHG